MIVGVCADKGSPGVTTLATALGMAWPGQAVVMEADPSGGDLPFRARTENGDYLAGEPSVLTLAADARTGLPDGVFARYAQQTSWGVPVIQGAAGAARFTPVRALWPGVAGEAARWPGLVVADLGRLQPGGPALPVARAAKAMLVLTRFTVGDLYHLRERVEELAHTLGDTGQDRNPVTVVIATRRQDRKTAVRQVTSMLASLGSPIPVAGVFIEDTAAAAELAEGKHTRRVRNSDLLKSAKALAQTLTSWWPQLADPSAGLRVGDEQAGQLVGDR